MSIISSLKRTPYQTVASLLVLYLSLFLIGALFLFSSFVYGLLVYIETRPQVTIYFQPTASEEEIFSIRDELMQSGKVSSIEYISQSDAYSILKEITQDNPLLLEMTSQDILPASLEIFTTSPGFLNEIATQVENRPGVDEVQFQQVIVERLLNLTAAIRNTSFFVTLFLTLMTIIVMVATTSFKVALKRHEIEILQLLGASDFYILKPFLAEGISIGLLSSILSTSSLVGLLYFGSPSINNYLQGIPEIVVDYLLFEITIWPFNPVPFLATFGLTALFGMLIGTIANFLAARKYLS